MNENPIKIKRVKIVGDGRFTKVFDVDTNEEIHLVQRVAFEQRMESNGLRGRALVSITTTAILEHVDVIGEMAVPDETAKSA